MNRNMPNATAVSRMNTAGRCMFRVGLYPRAAGRSHGPASSRLTAAPAVRGAAKTRRRRRPSVWLQVQFRLANCSASPCEAHSCMSLILPSRNVMTTGLLSVGTPSAPVQCAEPMTLSSPAWVSERLSIFQPPLVFKTSRASSGPRQAGVRFHQRWPCERPRHSASSAIRDANGSGSPCPSASAADRSSSTIDAAIWDEAYPRLGWLA